MKAIARLLIRFGVSHGEFTQVAKRAFIEVANEDFRLENGKQSISRVATLTGLRRHEVSEILKKIDNKEIEEEKLKLNRSALVMRGWLADNDYKNKNGKPKSLYLTDQEPSFKTLVKKYSKDITHGTILDELLRNNLVTVNQNRVKLSNEQFLDTSSINQTEHTIPNDIAEFIETIEHNLNSENTEKLLQRKMFINNISLSNLPLFREHAKSIGQKCLESYLDWASKQPPAEETDESKPQKNISLGVYYHEG